MNESRILVVDDDGAICELLSTALSHWGHRVAVAATAGEALDLLKGQVFDATLVDIRMPGMNGMELLREIRRHDAAIDVLIMTAYPTVNTAVEALKLGAYDYLTKPLILDELRHLLGHILERRFLRQEVSTLRSRLGAPQSLKEVVGSSAAMERVREIVAKVSTTDSPILIEGDSGTGKEVVAGAIHRLSTRSNGPFIPVNCSAIPSELLESEFFGHVRGAFTGAVSDAPGLFRSANNGTLFLDEVAELPPGLQVKLLRVIEQKEVRPVGSTKTYGVDVRIIAATNRQPEEALREGSLRQDFFYRLNVVRILMPLLRDRKADIPTLVIHFIRQFNQRFGREVKGVSPEAMAALMVYEFPGNVRELENLLERAYAFGAREEITPADLPALPGQAPAAAPSTELPTLNQSERDLILRALKLHDHNKEDAARALGVSVRTIYRRLKEYGLV